MIISLLKVLTVLSTLFGAISTQAAIPGVDPQTSLAIIGFSAAAFKLLDLLEQKLKGQIGAGTTATTMAVKAQVIMAVLLGAGLGLSACKTASTNATVAALENPNNEAKVVTGAVSIATTRFLQVNPSYQGETDAVADALVVLASGNPATLTTADITAALAKTPLSSATQKELGTDLPLALDMFNTAFAINFPGVPPNYAIFLDATANGIYAATGKPTVTLPVIPWPPVTPTPTPTPAPAS